MDTRIYAAKRDWERAIDALADIIAVFDASGRVLRGNLALAAYLGVPVTALARYRCCEVGLCRVPGEECAVRATLADGCARRTELIGPDERTFSVTTLPLDRTANGGAAAIQVARDITDERRRQRELERLSEELGTTNAHLCRTLEELRAAQQQLIQSEKLSALGQLVAGVAHELNNPLTSVIGYAQLVRHSLAQLEGHLPAEELAVLAGDVRRIGEEAERATRVIRDLLAFARRQAGERTECDVRELVRRVVALRSYDLRVNDIALEEDFDTCLPAVWADAHQIQQALLNIVLNAEQALATWTGPRLLKVGARYDEEAGAVALFVSDSGPGIDPAALGRIFDPFFTTKPVGRGPGLGLSLCYGIIRNHGGAIWAESEPLGGTTIWIQLPARRAPVSPDRPVSVLVGHGDAATREFLAAALTGWGYRALGVASAAAAELMMSEGVAVALVEGTLYAQDRQGWDRVLSGPAGVPVVWVVPSPDVAPPLLPGAGHRTAVVAGPPFSLSGLARALTRTLREDR